MQFVALCDYLITIAPTDAGISCMEAGSAGALEAETWQTQS